MGVIHRALDLLDGRSVAVKIARSGANELRFGREIAALQALSHPHIVGYLANGLTEEGTLFLAMEWLEGEDLGTRLKRGPLSASETLAVAHQAASALAFAHGLGIVHRDIKPRNLWLCPPADGAPFVLKLLDFGISRVFGASSLSLADAVVGTPGYMAPEQVRGGREVSASVDVFSLGCVLYECLSCQPPFAAQHVLGMLAKILFDPVPDVRDARPDVPVSLAKLVATLMTKERAQRPADGAAIQLALSTLQLVHNGEPRPLSSSTLFGGQERRMITLLVIGSGLNADGATPVFASLTPGELEPELRAATLAHRGAIELLADGTAIITFGDAPTPTDQATRAANCALSLRALASPRPISLVTGRTDPDARTPVGHTVDRAASMFERAKGEAEEGILLDQLTGHLLDARFTVKERGGQLRLVAQQSAIGRARPLLGQDTPFIGRDLELKLLQVAWQAVNAGATQALLVVAPAGLGKSRLAAEFSRSIASSNAAIWVGRGDPLRSDSALDLLRRMLRSALALRDDVGHDSIRARVRAALHGAELSGRDEALMAELLGVPASEAAADPQRAHLELQTAFIRFVAVVTARSALMLVLEDLHWADAASLHFLDALLRELPSAPLLLLGLARPELSARFPSLWSRRGLQQLSLKGLAPLACERVVRRLVAGTKLRVDVDRIVALAEGNPFYLEELARTAALGESELPETVLAMVEARLDAVSEAERQVLRAASVFGDCFWGNGLRALCEDEAARARVAGVLEALLERELVVRRSESRFAEESEFVFRHALLREGAYARLTAEDARAAHAAVASWLEQRGEEPGVLALHYGRGADSRRAGHYTLLAAQRAHRGGDFAASIALAKRGLACDVDEKQAMELHSLIVMAHGVRGDYDASANYIADNQPPEGAPLPDEFALVVVMTKLMQHDHVPETRHLIEVLDSVLDVPLPPERIDTWCSLVGWTVTELDVMGLYDAATPRFRRIRAVLSSLESVVPSSQGWSKLMRCAREVTLRDAPYRGLQMARDAAAQFAPLSDPFAFGIANTYLGLYCHALGAYGEAIATLEQTRGLEIGSVASLRDAVLSSSLVALGRLDHAHAQIETMAANPGAQLPTDRGRTSSARGLLALAAGNFSAAEHHFALATTLLGRSPGEQISAWLLRRRTLIEQGVTAGVSDRAEEVLDALIGAGYEGPLRRRMAQAHAEAAYSIGDYVRARREITEARARLLLSTNEIAESRYRVSFLEDVSENARLLALAAELGIQEPGE